jgi:tetratricopeptide (TPR) repeat protein
MTESPSILSTRYRLARLYLDKLRAAHTAFRRGHESAAYGLGVFEKDQGQIEHWHQWAASRSTLDPGCACLCIRFALDGYHLFYIRQHPQERIERLATALAAARLLRDTPAECALLFYLFRAYFAINALDEANDYAQQLYSLANAVQDVLHYGRAIYALGCIQEERGAYAEAREHYQTSLDIFEELRAAEDMSATLNGLGSVELYLANYHQAHTYFLRHLGLAEKSGRETDLCRALFAVAHGYYGLDDFTSAKAYAERGVALCRALNYKGMLCGGLLTLGSCQIELGNLESGSLYLEEGVQLARDIAQQRSVIHGLSSLGYTQFRLGQYTKARETLGEALAMARQAGQPRFVCNVLRNLTNTRLMMGDLDTAQEELLEGVTLAQSLGGDYQKTKTLCSAVLLWQRRGWLEQAAIWTGAVVDSSDIDEPVFHPIFAELEATLGSERYRLALEQGRAQSLDDALLEVQEALTAMMERSQERN